jgi:Putative Ig domain
MNRKIMRIIPFLLLISSVSVGYGNPKSKINLKNVIKVKSTSIFSRENNSLKPVRSRPNKSYCPYYCYNHSTNTSKLYNWCRAQTFCKTNRYNTNSNRKSYSSSYRYQNCPSNCFHPYRDYQKMKQWCFARAGCSTSGNYAHSMNPSVLLNKNYSLRNYNYQKVGKFLRFTLKNYGTNYKWSVTNLPGNATFNTHTLEFIWKPSSWHVGSNFVVFTVTNGKSSSSKTIELKVKEKWESFFLPGLAYTTYIPNNTAKLGIYHGLSINYILLAWVHRNEKRGPSHGRLYFKLDILNSTKDLTNLKGDDLSGLIYWAFGVDLSFERNPKRPFAIPFFGLEIGGSYSPREMEKADGEGFEKIGGVFHITPTFGIHLWSDQNFFVSLSGGYSFPVSDYDDFRGWRVNFGVNFTFW